MNGFDMVVLSATYHKQALETALQIFRYDPNAKDDIREAFKKTLYPERYVDIGKRMHWLLIDRKSKKVVGMVGLYTQTPDRKEPYWLGWFGVLDEYRSLGLGKLMFQWVLDELRRRNKTVLKIETSDLHYAQSAVLLYKKFDCKQIRRISQTVRNIRYNKLIFEKQLVVWRAFFLILKYMVESFSTLLSWCFLSVSFLSMMITVFLNLWLINIVQKYL